MFLPKSKYKGPFTASDGEKKILVEATKEVFKGQYFITYKNELFEGRFPKEAGRKLIYATELEKKEKESNVLPTPKPALIKPTEKDYENKRFTRYFVQDKRTEKILEVNLATFKESIKLPSYKTLSLEWWIEGPVEDTYFNGYLYIGAKSRNLKTVETAEKSLKGIKNYLFQLDEFVI